MTDTDTEPTQLADSRCTLCAWVGATDTDRCPECGYGLVEYNLTFND